MCDIHNQRSPLTRLQMENFYRHQGWGEGRQRRVIMGRQGGMNNTLS
jgi:hypothetical protein